MTHQNLSPEGNQPLYKEKAFWTQVVLPLLCALGFGIGAGAIADHEAKNLEKALNSGDTSITLPGEPQPTPTEVR